MDDPKIKTIVPWLGSARMVAQRIGRQLDGCGHVLIPFCGGLPELLFIKAPSVVCNDEHRLLINLCMVEKDKSLSKELRRRLKTTPFDPDILRAAQNKCLVFENEESHSDLVRDFIRSPDLDLAEAYFVSMWMGRSANAGTADEFRGNLSVRWKAGGGDSALRFRNAALSLRAWYRQLQRCNFYCLNAFDFLAHASDIPSSGVYCDAPWIGAGDDYKHTFKKHEQLAEVLGKFKQARVVVRYGDHPRIRALYASANWHWLELAGRTQANKDSGEVLIVNGPLHE